MKSFTMDAESRLNVTGKGPITGRGHDNRMGASYAGQGGAQPKDSKDLTYGSFDQLPDTSVMNNAQMGSGGGTDTKRGGGVIIIYTQTANINGELVANGAPFTTKIGESYNAGSGGYIFVNCTSSP
jgi:hypothetical protein